MSRTIDADALARRRALFFSLSILIILPGGYFALLGVYGDAARAYQDWLPGTLGIILLALLLSVAGYYTLLALPLRAANELQRVTQALAQEQAANLVREESLRESRERFDLAVRGSSDGIWDWNILTGEIYVSERWCELLGYRYGEVKIAGNTWAEWIHPEDVDTALGQMRQHFKLKTPYNSEYRIRVKGGDYRWFLNRGQAIWNEQGRAIRIAGSTSDITERKIAEEQLRKLSLAVEQSPESIVITNLKAEIEYVNEAFIQKTGYSRDEVLGKNPRILHSGKTSPETFAGLWEAMTQGQPWKGEFHNRRNDGSEYFEQAVITPIRQKDGSITHFVAVKEDITARKAAEERINTLAFYDPLTNLPNRRLLLDRLQQALASSTRSARYGALLFIDLDNFKTLNDTLGHDIGDLLLQQVAQRLTGCVREGDTVSRLGGDEFVVMLEDLSESARDAATQAETVGEKILARLNQAYQLASHEHRSTPSIGVTLFVGHQGNIDELLKRADMAMYQAKAAGRNTLRFFDPDMQSIVTKRAALEADLHDAVWKDQFLLYYQAQVVGEGFLTGAEALLRWQHPERGMVSPANFIPLAEETGLILPLGHWVLQTACHQLAIWARQPEMAHLSVAVNVSARQFSLPNFVEEVLAIIEHNGTNPQRLKLELTEGLLVDDVEDIIAKMTALKAKGVGFSMDDFGTGYSSLSYLKRLPLDQLKIDQSFVRNILTDPNDAAIAKMVVALAESMGLTVIAEGVEIEAQRDFLAHHGCHAYQGYLFSRPLPLDEFESFARRT
jgi:diguanylate cyclase (GGDEF)-like protein/PAS domain S-box-containing protein